MSDRKHHKETAFLKHRGNSFLMLNLSFFFVKNWNILDRIHSTWNNLSPFRSSWQTKGNTSSRPKTTTDFQSCLKFEKKGVHSLHTFDIVYIFWYAICLTLLFTMPCFLKKRKLGIRIYLQKLICFVSTLRRCT